MEAAIQDLVNMQDIESLYEVMTENDDFMYCLDAAEGLVQLGDERGIEFLTDATQSEDKDIRSVAQEILDSPEIRRKRAELESATRQDLRSLVEPAHKRLQQGKTVFLYKSVYLPANYFMSAVPAEHGDNVDALNEFGFEGWEVVAFLPGPVGGRRGNPGVGIPGSTSIVTSGGYFLLKKEISADESAQLDAL